MSEQEQSRDRIEGELKTQYGLLLSQSQLADLRRRGDLGRDGVYKVLRELRDAGYILYQRKRDSSGRLRGGDYYVNELPAHHIRHYRTRPSQIRLHRIR